MKKPLKVRKIPVHHEHSIIIDFRVEHKLKPAHVLYQEAFISAFVGAIVGVCTLAALFG